MAAAKRISPPRLPTIAKEAGDTTLFIVVPDLLDHFARDL